MSRMFRCSRRRLRSSVGSGKSPSGNSLSSGFPDEEELSLQAGSAEGAMGRPDMFFACNEDGAYGSERSAKGHSCVFCPKTPLNSSGIRSLNHEERLWMCCCHICRLSETKEKNHGLEHTESYRNPAGRRNQLVCLRREEISHFPEAPSLRNMARPLPHGAAVFVHGRPEAPQSDGL